MTKTLTFANSGTIGEAWMKTMDIRWFIKSMTVGKFTKQVKVLQQRWQGSAGGEKWEIIETYEETIEEPETA